MISRLMFNMRQFDQRVHSSFGSDSDLHHMSRMSDLDLEVEESSLEEDSISRARSRFEDLGGAGADLSHISYSEVEPSSREVEPVLWFETAIEEVSSRRLLRDL